MLVRDNLPVKGPTETQYDLLIIAQSTTAAISLHPTQVPVIGFAVPFATNMLRKAGGGASKNIRPIYALGLIILIFLWVWKFGSPAPLPTLEKDAVQPKLNTSWHKQIAVELTNNKTGLTGMDTPLGMLDRTRVALLIESRPLPYLVPLLLHFISVVPPEWSFRFMGSTESVALMESNPTLRRYIEMKKLFLDLIPYDIVASVDVRNHNPFRIHCPVQELQLAHWTGRL